MVDVAGAIDFTKRQESSASSRPGRARWYSGLKRPSTAGWRFASRPR